MVAFVEKAINVELSNLSELKDLAGEFPTSEIGVAQGNSLSPLLGNIVLADFDRLMNEGDCRCIRYIDDFIILAPTAKAANARLRVATRTLGKLGMELSPDKTSKGAQRIDVGITFLGIELNPGFIRPSEQSRSRLLKSVDTEFAKSAKAFERVRKGEPPDRALSLVSTLRRVSDIVDGWGKHYWFCNDGRCFQTIDADITIRFRAYISRYANIKGRTSSSRHSELLGMARLGTMGRQAFQYPRRAGKPAVWMPPKHLGEIDGSGPPVSNLGCSL